jgi:PAS domain S-box-containing protein
MQRHFDRGMLAVLGLLVALIVADSLVAYNNIEELYHARTRVGVSRQVQATLREILSAVKDAETGVRGFVITGDEKYLEPYEAALRSIDAMVRRVSSMTQSNPIQQDRLPMLKQRVEERLLELSYTLEQQRTRGFQAAREVVVTDWGKITMDGLRTEVDGMYAEETRVLEERNALSLRSIDLAHASSFLSALLGLLMVAALVQQMRRNLHARDRAAAVIHESRELFRTTLASLLESVVTTDAEGRITYMNAEAEALTGVPERNALGRPVGEVVRVVDERLRQPVENSAQRALREGEAVAVAHRYFLADPDGAPRVPIDDSATLLRDAGGRVTGAVLVFRDISQRKRSQDALVDADRKKDEFLAVLAHELRNPLAPLRNALQIARMANNDPATVKPLWGMMERQIQQMVRLIDDLLDVSRITRNKLQLRKEAVDMAEVLEAALEMSAPVVERYDQRVEVSIAPGRHFVDGDRARLVQVVDNLVGNAAKYSEKPGTIRVSIAQDHANLRIGVKDEGIGIPREMLERVFEMFTQVDRSLERTRGGLGIGLTLVRRLVELHGGSVTAWSEGPGKGSEFVVKLPAMQHAPMAAPAAPGTQALAAPTGNPHRVLVVDDNEDAAQTLAKSLAIMGHEVRAVYNGAECLRLSETFHPEIVFLDIGMPRLNGYDTARRLRGEPWARNTMLVAITGWGQDEDRRRAREAGFDHHLVKPIDFAALARIMDAYAAKTVEPAHAQR